MLPIDPVLFIPSQPGGPDFPPLIALALGLVLGYLLGRTDWLRWRDWLPGAEP